MGSPLGLALALIICSFENKWLKDCPHSLKPVFHRRYVVDIFVFFPLSIMQKSLKSIYVPSIPIKLFVRERK